MADLSSPSSLFRDATWDDIGVNTELTAFLQRITDPGGRNHGDISRLREEVLTQAKQMRGDGLWLTLFDTPRHYPSDLSEHKYLNLLERLYLSSPGGYGQRALFGEDLPPREKRQTHIAQRTSVGVAIPAAIAASAWWVARKKAVADPKSKASVP